MDKQVKLFFDFLKDDKKLSENTLQSYRRDIEQYEKYVEENKINYLKITEDTVLEYMEYLREENKNTPILGVPIKKQMKDKNKK